MNALLESRKKETVPLLYIFGAIELHHHEVIKRFYDLSGRIKRGSNVSLVSIKDYFNRINLKTNV